MTKTLRWKKHSQRVKRGQEEEGHETRAPGTMYLAFLGSLLQTCQGRPEGRTDHGLNSRD